jgi:BlaI family transcriptional regulator, penicillinase repressor
LPVLACISETILYIETALENSFAVGPVASDVPGEITVGRLPSSQPTEVELQILRVLWEGGPSTVGEIHKALTAEKETNYSTTVKMLSVMLDKGLVKRDESIRPHVYRSVVPQKTTQQRMLRDLIQKAYDGSAGSLVLQALSSQQASQEELAEIRRLLDELQGEGS